jgi:hypothetical protein
MAAQKYRTHATYDSTGDYGYGSVIITSARGFSIEVTDSSIWGHKQFRYLKKIEGFAYLTKEQLVKLWTISKRKFKASAETMALFAEEKTYIYIGDNSSIMHSIESAHITATPKGATARNDYYMLKKRNLGAASQLQKDVFWRLAGDWRVKNANNEQVLTEQEYEAMIQMSYL